MYTPKYKPNQIIVGTGSIVIVTGWTVRSAVAKKLEPHEYAGIGNLYSPTRGINFLVRNLLANPCVQAIVIIDATQADANAKACQCLKDLFYYGVSEGKTDTGKDCWVVNSPIVGYVDKEVSREAITSLPCTMAVVVVHSVKDAIEKVKELNSVFKDFRHAIPSREPLIFPLVESTPSVFPGERYGHRVEGKTIAETWVKILHRIKTTGTIRPTGYDGNWQELIDLMAVVTDEPEDFYFPEPNYLPLDRPFLQEYIPQILEDAPYREGVKYTYGQRLRSWFGQDQVEKVITKLIGEIDSASAVMSLWDSGTGNHLKAETLLERTGFNVERFGRELGDSDHDHGGSPCLNHIWVRVVDNELSLTATFRSNDMFAAWPSNAMGLRALQRHIRDEIADRSEYDLTMGPLITISQSAHIYDDCWENVDRLIENHYKPIALDKIKAYDDPCGSFLVEWVNHKIKVTRITPGSGEVVSTYEGRDPLQLTREIAIDCPAITPAHIGYLGIELERAKWLRQDYVQDRK